MEPRGKLIRPKKSNVQLMFNTHDPLEEIHRAERAQEDDYFRKLDQELIVALREKSAAEIEQVIRQYTRMRCPKCGEPLKETPSRRIKIDACPGRLSETFIYALYSNYLVGQCSELCGINHGFMPINVITLPDILFYKWLNTVK